jgi:hypothetical protein
VTAPRWHGDILCDGDSAADKNSPSYGYGWTTVITPGGGVRDDATLVVETLVQSVLKNTLLWAGGSTSTNPKGAQKFITELVAAAIKELKNERLAK